MNTKGKGWDAGTPAVPFSLQKQCHISTLAPYTMQVSSSHAWSIMSFMHSHSVSLVTVALAGFGGQEAGVHSLSQSLVRQCGQRQEGVGLRCCRYGAGPLVVGVLGGRIGRWHNLASEALHCLVTEVLTPMSTTS